jgi:hypothetical protein
MQENGPVISVGKIYTWTPCTYVFSKRRRTCKAYMPRTSPSSWCCSLWTGVQACENAIFSDFQTIKSAQKFIHLTGNPRCCLTFCRIEHGKGLKTAYGSKSKNPIFRAYSLRITGQVRMCVCMKNVYVPCTQAYQVTTLPIIGQTRR